MAWQWVKNSKEEKVSDVQDGSVGVDQLTRSVASLAVANGTRVDNSSEN